MSSRGKVGMIGSGVMGHGITIACALGGYDGSMADTTKEILVRASDRINADFTGLVKNGLVTEKGAKTALARITTTTIIADAVGGSKLVTEAITEQRLPSKTHDRKTQVDYCCFCQRNSNLARLSARRPIYGLIHSFVTCSHRWNVRLNNR